jgi:hypothetical protein
MSAGPVTDTDANDPVDNQKPATTVTGNQLPQGIDL